MNIGIDARMYGPTVGGGGLGRYIEKLVNNLQAIDNQNRYVLFLKKENFDACKITNPLFEKRVANIHWYTLKEQLNLGKQIDNENLDLMHFPHWNVPVRLKTPFVVTIHDLILLDEPHSSKISTKNSIVFYFKYLGYKFVLQNAITKSQKIITVSNATKNSIQKWFPEVNNEKIKVVYEGATRFASKNSPIPPLHTTEISNPYLLYIGNAYPHKNLENLLKAFELFSKTHKNVNLILAGHESIFYKKLLKEKNRSVIFVPHPADSDLSWLYEHASLFVFPSRCEGFGLPPLEAMSYGLPVVASDISSLREVLETSAIFFPPNDPEKIAQTISFVFDNEKIKTELSQKGKEQIKKYSWNKMAKEIKDVYQSCEKSSF